MSTKMIAPRFHRLLACLACALGTAVTCAPPAAAMPEIMLASQVRPGMKGVGKSVFEGTKVETFPITVLGVLEKMDYGGGDMIVIRVDGGPVVKQHLGIVGGMSGSPIYIQGKLIGAIAWSYWFSSLPIAGVTPIEQMMEAYQPGWSSGAVQASGTWRGDPITIGGRKFTKFAAARDGAAAAAGSTDTMVFRPLATPLVVSGLGPASMKNLTKLLEPHNLVPIPGPGPVGKPMHVNLEPGSAIGVQLVSGDIDISAVGTVTCIDGDKVIAFGHPMLGLGATDVPLTTAYVHGVWPSARMSFKLASPIEQVGHWTQDRMWSVGGTLGTQADTLPATFRLADGDRKVSRTFNISAFRDPDWTSYLIVGTLLDALWAISSPGATDRGSQRVRLRIDLEGMPPIERQNTFTVERMPGLWEFFAFFASPYAFSPLGELYEVLDLASNNPFERVRINGVEIEFEVSSERLGARLEAVRPDKRVVRPGDEVTLDVLIRPYGQDPVTRTISVEIPEHLPKGKLQIGIAGGQSARGLARSMGIEGVRPKSAEQLFARIRERASNDDLVVELILPTVGLQLESERLPNLPNSVLEILQSSSASGIEVLRDHRRSSQRSPWVVSGVKMITLLIDSDEKNKTGESAPPGSRFPGRGGFADIFMTGMWYGDDYDYETTWRRTLASPIGALLWSDRLRALAAAGDSDIEMPPMPSWEEVEALSEEGLEADSFEDAMEPGTGKAGKKTKAIARPPGIWVEQTQKDFAKGKVTNAVVADDGQVRLWPALTSIEAATDLCLWAQARSADGALYVGAWGSGTIYQQNGENKLEPFAETGAAAVTAMLAAPEGGLYAATYPGGDIHRIAADGTVSDYCHLNADYIWAIGFDGAGSLWAAAGSPAGVYRMDGDGRAEMLFRPPDRHAIALATAPEGGVYVGTYPQGRVYFVDPSGHTRGVFEAPTAAVQALALDQEGNLYVGTSPKAFVYRIAPDGTTTELLKARERHITALGVDDVGNVYAATGQNGKIYRITSDRSVSDYRDKAISAVASLAVTSDVVTICGVGATRVMTGRLDGSVEGTYTSSVHDAAAPARWGRISWTASDGDGSIEVSTRSGNTILPDETWSGWSPVRLEGEEASVASPPARYIQYQVRINSDHANRAPALQRMELIYMSKNQAPTLAIKSPRSGEAWSGKKKVRWSGDDPNKDKLTYQVFYSRDQGASWTEIKGKTEESTEEVGEEEEPETDEESPESKKPPAAKPAAEDESRFVPRAPDDGSLVSARHRTFGDEDEFDSVFGDMSGFDEDEEFLSGEDDEGEEDLFGISSSGLGSKDLAWDTTKVPDGVYLLKVVATDEGANPDDPMTAERITPPVRVDNTPPEITGGAPSFLLTPPRSLTVSDRASRVASAEYRVDSKEWHAAVAADGIFDNLTETINIDPSVLLLGHHVLEVRMRDGAGNETTESVRYFLSRAPKTTAE